MAEHPPVPRPGPARLGGLGALQDEDGAALAGHVAARPGVERQVGPLRIGGRGQLAGGELRGQAVRAQRGVRAAGEHQPRAPAGQPPGLGDGVEAAGLFAGEDAAGAAHPVPDGELPGGGRVEPGYRLVGADPGRVVPVQRRHLLLAELRAARGRGGHHGHLVLGQRGRVDARVPERLLGGGERQVRPVVRLGDQPVGPYGGPRVEVRYLAGQAYGVTGHVEAGGPADRRGAGQGRRPVVLDAEARRGDDAYTGDHRGPGGPGAGHVSVLPAAAAAVPGRVSSIAVWKPPKPLPTLSTTSIACSRAVSGT